MMEMAIHWQKTPMDGKIIVVTNFPKMPEPQGRMAFTMLLSRKDVIDLVSTPGYQIMIFS